MKALMQSRTTLFSVPGGDTIQMLKTAEALRIKGCAVDISTELEPDLTGIDIVHLFNLTRPQEVYLQARNAQRQHRLIVLSPIYMSYREYEQRARKGLFGLLTRYLNQGQTEYLKIMARAVSNLELNKGTFRVLIEGYSSLLNKIIDMTDVLLPNSESEIQRAGQDFERIREKRYVVVPNAIDEKIFDPANSVPSDTIGKFPGSVICVARIEGRKDQLTLVRAMKNLPWPLVLIGKPAPNHRDYFDQIRAEAGPNVHIIGEIAHQDLAHFYKAAKVHVLASWMETTGLSSLEAGAMDCNLVITDRGDTRDFFGDYAYYSEPGSVDSLRAAIIKAYESPVEPQLRQHIIDNFTWTKAAEKTLEGYRLALNSNHRKGEQS